MEKNILHAKRIGHETGMLSARATKAVERIARHIIAALDGNFLDGLDHIGNRNADETIGNGFRRTAIADFSCQRGEAFTHPLHIQRLVLVGAKDCREKFRQKLAQHDIGIGDGERSAVAIAGWTGIGACRIRSDTETPGVVMQDRTAACGNGVDQHHRRAHTHTGNFRFKSAFIFAVEMRDIRGGAAHVKADDIRETSRFAGPGEADDAACRAGEDCILALKQIGCGETARRHHEHDARAGALDVQLIGYLRNIAAKNRRQIGIDDRGVATTDQLDQWRNFMADGDLLEAETARNASNFSLMCREFISMHERDGDGFVALFLQCSQYGFRLGGIERRFNRAVCLNAFVQFHDLFIKRFRLDDLGRKDVLALLIANAQRIAKTLGGDKGQPLALALEKRIGRDRRSHANFADNSGGNRFAGPEAKMQANAVNGGILIGRRIFGENLACMELALRISPDDVRKRTAAVDPEVPYSASRSAHRRLPYTALLVHFEIFSGFHSPTLLTKCR